MLELGATVPLEHPRLSELRRLWYGRQQFIVGPTPLHRAPRLSARLGRQVWLKRDDLTGTALGGNKIRKLEFIATQALASWADAVSYTHLTLPTSDLV